MIKTIIFLILLTFMSADAQYTFTAQEMINMKQKIERLVEADSLKTSMISQQSELIARYEYQAGLDSLLLEYKDEHVLILEDRVEIYKNELKSKEPKWWMTPEMYRVQGMLIILLSAYVVGLVGA